MNHRQLLAKLSLLAALAPSINAQISGVVMDSITASPIGGAIVTVQRSLTLKATTAPDGSFSIPAAMGASITIVGAAKGYFHEGVIVSTPATGVHISMEPVIIGTNTNYFFLSPSTCAGCHGTQWEQWNNSPMGQTGTNTWVHDLFSGTGTAGGMNGFVYTRDSAHASTVPNSSCAACHQPEKWVKNPGVAMDPISSMSVDAFHGVSCEVCHKIANIDTNLLNTHGPTAPSVTFNLPNDPVALNQVMYGVLGDVTFRIDGLMRASYQPQLVAEMCAACHQYNNDHDEDGDFEEASSPEGQATYEEWANSPYADPNSASFATCVDCHMPTYDSTEVCGLGLPARDTSQPRQHRIEGTTPAFLQNAVDLAMNVVDNGTSLDIQVDITNSMAGHKVPTGVSPRNMILIVEAWRQSDGQALTHTGSQTVNFFGGVGAPVLGYYAGLPGKIYAKVANDINGLSAPVFTEAETLRFDTRIAPLATDTTNYQFAVPAGAGTLRVRARLVYRRAFRYIVDAKGWTTTGRGQPLPDIQGPNYGVLMEESTWSTPGGLPAQQNYGAGCNGMSINPLNQAYAGNAGFGFLLTGARPTVPVLLALGFSNTVDGPWTLPYDLTPLGAPGCSILASLHCTSLTNTDPFGIALFPFPLPVTTPPGIEFFAQWLAWDQSNPLGVSTSDGVSIITQP